MDDNSARPSQQSVDSDFERLEELNRRIHEAEKQLALMYNQQRVLEKQIEIGRALNAPINRLPVEIRSEIWDNTLYCDHFDDFLGPGNCQRGLLPGQMLVCKQWRSTIKASSRFWKSLCLITGEELTYDAKWVRQQRKYLRLCLSRSKGSLLELTVDFRFHLPAFTYVNNKIVEAFRDIVSEDELDELDLDIPALSPLGMHYDTMFEGLVGILFGPNSIHLRRCRTLNLRLSSEDHLPKAIWSLLNAEAPKMERLSLLSYGPLPRSNTIPRLKLPSVTRLAIFDHVTLKNIPVCVSMYEK